MTGRVDFWPDRDRSDWSIVGSGESGDRVYRRSDGCVYAKVAPAERAQELAGERDRLLWLRKAGFACPEPLDWREGEDGARLEMRAVPGVPASDLSGADLVQAWPSICRMMKALHSVPADACPFDRSLSRMIARATDVVARGAVNPEFLSDSDSSMPADQLLAMILEEAPRRLRQEETDRVVCHGDACMPNVMVDPDTLEALGLIDLGRLGVADRYVDLALMVANAGESWSSPAQEKEALTTLFGVLEIGPPDRERLAFYLRLDPLTWG